MTSFEASFNLKELDLNELRWLCTAVQDELFSRLEKTIQLNETLQQEQVEPVAVMMEDSGSPISRPRSMSPHRWSDNDRDSDSDSDSDRDSDRDSDSNYCPPVRPQKKIVKSTKPVRPKKAAVVKGKGKGKCAAKPRARSPSKKYTELPPWKMGLPTQKVLFDTLMHYHPEPTDREGMLRQVKLFIRMLDTIRDQSKKLVICQHFFKLIAVNTWFLDENLGFRKVIRLKLGQLATDPSKEAQKIVKKFHWLMDEDVTTEPTQEHCFRVLSSGGSKGQPVLSKLSVNQKLNMSLDEIIQSQGVGELKLQEPTGDHIEDHAASVQEPTGINDIAKVQKTTTKVQDESEIINNVLFYSQEDANLENFMQLAKALEESRENRQQKIWTEEELIELWKEDDLIDRLKDDDDNTECDDDDNTECDDDDTECD